MNIEELNKKADASWEGCDSCDENDKMMWVNGYIAGALANQVDYTNITRFEVIDHTLKMGGRVLVEHDVNVEVSIQDEGRTMKVFLTEKQ